MDGYILNVSVNYSNKIELSLGPNYVCEFLLRQSHISSNTKEYNYKEINKNFTFKKGVGITIKCS